MFETKRGVFIFDSAISRAFSHGCGKQPSRMEAFMTRVRLDKTFGQMSLAMYSEIPSTPDDFDCILWITLRTSESLTGVFELHPDL